jgi:hypothetical protein
MTGPEHFRAAEAALRFVNDEPPSSRDWHGAQLALQLAQVHATLALTAATAQAFVPSIHFQAWQEVTR